LRNIRRLVSAAFDFYAEKSMFSRRFCGPRATNEIERWRIAGLIQDSCGVTAIEYALIAALIAVAAIAAFTLVGTNLSTTFSYVASQL
jgi:pilus assembly protein Flp/PilA